MEILFNGMKKLVILFCVLLFSGYVHAQTDCSLYRKGYYMFTDSTGDTILIHRRNKYQYEYNRKVKEKTQYEVTWVNDCEYTITQRITNSRALKKYRNNVTKVVISKSDGGNGYYYTCSCIDGTLKRKENFLKKITMHEFYQLY